VHQALASVQNGGENLCSRTVHSTPSVLPRFSSLLAALAPVGSTVYWAFPWRFWHFAKGAYPATYDVAAMASRDGLNFSYIDDRRPFISTGRDGTPGSRRIRVLPSPVVVGDTM
jgi:hypothetical protein